MVEEGVGGRVRAATDADVRALQGIEDAADALYLERFRPDSWEPAAPGHVRAAAPGFVLVVSERPSGKAVGFVHVLEVEGHAHLEQLAVRPEHGRRGHGRALVEAAKAEAAGRGYDRISLCTYADVPWNAPFYARCGFVETEPASPFHEELRRIERRLGLDRYGRRVQMVARLRGA